MELLCSEKVCQLHWDFFPECLEKYFQYQEQTTIVFQIRGVFLRIKDFANRRHSPKKLMKIREITQNGPENFKKIQANKLVKSNI